MLVWDTALNSSGLGEAVIFSFLCFIANTIILFGLFLAASFIGSLFLIQVASYLTVSIQLWYAPATANAKKMEFCI